MIFSALNNPAADVGSAHHHLKPDKRGPMPHEPESD
jgi:hypothetical protein